MTELWRRSSVLVWEHPVLWIPVLCADFLGFMLHQLQMVTGHEIVLWFVRHTHSSVLGGALDAGAQRSVTLKAAFLTLPILWGTFFIMICLYAVALTMTAGLVFQILAGQLPDMRSQITFVQQRRPLILSVSARIFGLLLVAMLVIGAITVGSTEIVSERLSLTTVALVEVILGYAAVAFLAVPWALSLVAGESHRLSAKSVKYTRQSTIVATTVSLLIGYLCSFGLNSLRISSSANHVIARLLTETCCSLLIALPYIPLFALIALTVYVSGDALSETQGVSVPDQPVG